MTDIEWLIEREKIINIIVAIANAMDEKNWQKLRKCLTDEIEIDYSEFRGDLPQRITADAYIQERIEGLSKLKTLHISTNHEVVFIKDFAQCRSAYRIYRFDFTNELGQDRLDTAGNYEHQLIKADGGWRVTAIKQTVLMISGNRRVHKGLSQDS